MGHRLIAWLQQVVQMIKRIAALLVVLVFASYNRAAEPITGVAPAALDQPRVYLQVARGVNGPALIARANDQKTSAVEAFLDTGASGIVLASNTAKALGIRAEQSASRSPVSYEDVGIGGTEKFAVSEPLFLSLAAYSSDIDGDTANYGKPIGPFLFQLKPGGDELDAFTGGTDIVGMPAMQNRVIVMDPRGLAKLDKIKTSLLPPNDRAIPCVSKTVPLTYVSFGRFSRIMPASAPGPASMANPMIGPDPF
jgi:hypothetical protein